MNATQLELLDTVPVPPETRLTPRQRYALEIIARFQPVPSDELGAHMCQRRGKHTADVRCEWDAPNGREVGGALRKKGLVQLRRDQGWVLAGYTPAANTDAYDPATSEWPAGF